MPVPGSPVRLMQAIPKTNKGAAVTLRRLEADYGAENKPLGSVSDPVSSRHMELQSLSTYSMTTSSRTSSKFRWTYDQRDYSTRSESV